MAEQDVQIKEVDVIRAYNQKFGEFSLSFSEHMHQLLNVLQEKLEMLRQAKQDIKREREKIDDEIYRARQRCEESYSHGSFETYYGPDGSSFTSFEPDYDYIRKCRREYEHLYGFVSYHAKECEELARNRLTQATETINMIEQRTNSLVSSFQNYVGRGKQYLDKVEQYIDQYKESNLNT